MNELTPNAVVANLLDLARDLARLSAGLDDLEIEVVNKREDYTRALARAELTAEGDTVGERKARALLATGNERLAAETAEALVRGRKRQLDTLKIRIDVGRSAAAALRAEISLGGVH